MGDGASLAAAAGFSLGHRRMHSTSAATGLGLASNGGSAAGTRSPSPLPGQDPPSPLVPDAAAAPPPRHVPRRIASVPAMGMLLPDHASDHETSALGSLRSSLHEDGVSVSDTSFAAPVPRRRHLNSSGHQGPADGNGNGGGPAPGSFRSVGPAEDGTDAVSVAESAQAAAAAARTRLMLDGAMQTLQELEGKGADFFAELAEFLNAFHGLVAPERRNDIETLELQVGGRAVAGGPERRDPPVALVCS